MSSVSDQQFSEVLSLLQKTHCGVAVFQKDLTHLSINFGTLTNRVDTLTDQVASLTMQVTTIEEQVSTVTEQVATVSDQVASLYEPITVMRKDIDSLTRQSAETTRDLDNCYKLIDAIQRTVQRTYVTKRALREAAA